MYLQGAQIASYHDMNFQIFFSSKYLQGITYCREYVDWKICSTSRTARRFSGACARSSFFIQVHILMLHFGYETGRSFLNFRKSVSTRNKYKARFLITKKARNSMIILRTSFLSLPYLIRRKIFKFLGKYYLINKEF